MFVAGAYLSEGCIVAMGAMTILRWEMMGMTRAVKGKSGRQMQTRGTVAVRSFPTRRLSLFPCSSVMSVNSCTHSLSWAPFPPRGVDNHTIIITGDQYQEYNSSLTSTHCSGIYLYSSFCLPNGRTPRLFHQSQQAGNTFFFLFFCRKPSGSILLCKKKEQKERSERV